MTAIKADADSYALAAQRRGKAETLRLAVFPGYGNFIGEDNLTTRETRHARHTPRTRCGGTVSPPARSMSSAAPARYLRRRGSMTASSA